MNQVVKIDPANKTTAFLQAADLVSRLQEAGFQAYFVGGGVRDLLLGLTPADFDVATNAKPEQVQSLFPKARGVGQKFGVSLIPGSEGEIEVAAFREDGPYFDHRRPAWVNYAGIEQDAQRRDFTVNGLYLDPSTDQVVDLVEGLLDLEERVLRVIGDPFERLDEDWLRLLRAIRFAARFTLEFEFRTWDAIRALAPLVTGVIAERRTEEIRSMLQGPHPDRAVGLLYTSGIWKALWPDLPFSFARLQKICTGLAQNHDPAMVWRCFFVDVPHQLTSEIVETLRLTRVEKKALEP